MKRLVCLIRGHNRRCTHNDSIDDYGYPGHIPWRCIRCGATCCPDLWVPDA